MDLPKYNIGDEVYAFHNFTRVEGEISKIYITESDYKTNIEYLIGDQLYLEEQVFKIDDYDNLFELGDNVIVTFGDKKSIVFGYIASITKTFEEIFFSVSLNDNFFIDSITSDMMIKQDSDKTGDE